MAVPNGSVVFQLNRDAQVIAAPGGQVLAAQETVFQFDSTGTLIQPAKIYSNKELNPQTTTVLQTYYRVTFYDVNGARINTSPLALQFTQIAGSTVDIGTMAPYTGLLS